MSNWKIQMVVGVLFALAGLMVLFNPFAASLAVEQLAGWAFLVIGVVQILEAIVAEGWGGKLWSLLLGLVAALIGINLIAKPLAGLMALTMILGIMFLVSGVFKLIVGWRIHMTQLKYAVVISGIVSALIGLIVLTNMPWSAVTVLGILLGIELLSNGVSIIALAMSRKTGGVAAKA